MQDEESYAFEDTSYYTEVVQAASQRHVNAPCAMEQVSGASPSVAVPTTSLTSRTSSGGSSYHEFPSPYRSTSTSSSPSWTSTTSKYNNNYQSRNSQQPRRQQQQPARRRAADPPARHIKEDHDEPSSFYAGSSALPSAAAAAQRQKQHEHVTTTKKAKPVLATHAEIVPDDEPTELRMEEPRSELESEDSLGGLWQRRRQQAARTQTPVARPVEPSTASMHGSGGPSLLSAAAAMAISQSRLLPATGVDSAFAYAGRLPATPPPPPAQQQYYGAHAGHHPPAHHPHHAAVAHHHHHHPAAIPEGAVAAMPEPSTGIAEASVLSERTWSTFDHFRSNIAQGEAYGLPHHQQQHQQEHQQPVELAVVAPSADWKRDELGSNHVAASSATSPPQRRATSGTLPAGNLARPSSAMCNGTHSNNNNISRTDDDGDNVGGATAATGAGGTDRRKNKNLKKMAGAGMAVTAGVGVTVVTGGVAAGVGTVAAVGGAYFFKKRRDKLKKKEAEKQHHDQQQQELEQQQTQREGAAASSSQHVRAQLAANEEAMERQRSISSTSNSSSNSVGSEGADGGRQRKFLARFKAEGRSRKERRQQPDRDDSSWDHQRPAVAVDNTPKKR